MVLPSTAVGQWIDKPEGPSFDLEHDTTDELTYPASDVDAFYEDVPVTQFVAVRRVGDGPESELTSGILLRRSTFTGGYWGMGTTSHRLCMYIHTGATLEVVNSDTIIAGTNQPSLYGGYQTYAVTRHPGGIWTFYWNREEIAQKTNTSLSTRGLHEWNVGHLSPGSPNTTQHAVSYLAGYTWIGNAPTAPSEIRDLHDDPYGPIRRARRRRVFVVVGGTTVAVGLATEADSALGLSSAKSRAVGLSSETDSALGVSSANAQAVGLSTETDSALAVAVAKAVTVALASEADSGLALSAAKAAGVGLASEADEGLAVTGLKTVTVGLSSETDTALVVSTASGTPVGQASEADTAFALSVAKALGAGLASETDTAQGLTPVRVIDLGQANEADTALALSALKAVTTGLAIETDAGLVVIASKSQAVGLALETDTSFAVVVEGVVVLFPITSKTGPALDGSMFGKATGGSMFGKALQE